MVGDGAVGLCGVLAAKRLGAERVIAMSRHSDRQDVARAFGATDIVEESGDEGVARVKDLLGGVVPTGGAELPIRQLFGSNVSVGGGVAPVRGYLEELLAATMDGSIDPGRVFDLSLPLEQVADAYAAMDERRSIKVLLRT